MGKEINHWCVVCGKGYHACDSCNETKSFTPWRILTDTIEHFKIFTVLKDYNNKVITKKEARDLLANIDISDSDSFKESSKRVLEEILKQDTQKQKAPNKKKISTSVCDNDMCIEKNDEKIDLHTIDTQE